MDQIDDSMRNQIAALLRVVNFTRCFKEDNVPCKIEEVIDMVPFPLCCFVYSPDFFLTFFVVLISISQGLFLGSVAAAYNMDALKHLNITHILTVASSLKPAHSNDFVYKIIPGRKVCL